MDGSLLGVDGVGEADPSLALDDDAMSAGEAYRNLQSGFLGDSSIVPSLGSTDFDRRFLKDATRFVHCDFSTLDAGSLLSNSEQNDKLTRSCSLSVSGANTNSMGTREIDVLETGGVLYGMSDLGSPHSSCGGHRSVTGSGGRSDGPFPNCEPQGKVVVLEQAEDDPMKGGCVNVDFVDPVVLNGLGLLNLPDDDSVKVTVSRRFDRAMVVLGVWGQLGPAQRLCLCLSLSLAFHFLSVLVFLLVLLWGFVFDGAGLVCV